MWNPPHSQFAVGPDLVPPGTNIRVPDSHRHPLPVDAGAAQEPTGVNLLSISLCKRGTLLTLTKINMCEMH